MHRVGRHTVEELPHARILVCAYFVFGADCKELPIEQHRDPVGRSEDQVPERRGETIVGFSVDEVVDVVIAPEPGTDLRYRFAVADFTQIDYEVRDSIATLTLSRPEKLNGWLDRRMNV